MILYNPFHMCAAPIYGGIHWILYLPTVWSYFKMCPIDMFLVFINFYYCNSNTSMSCFLIYIRIKSSQVWKHYSAPSIAVQQNSFDKQWKYSLVATLPLIKIPYLIKHSNMLKSWENREFVFLSQWQKIMSLIFIHQAFFVCASVFWL